MRRFSATLTAFVLLLASSAHAQDDANFYGVPWNADSVGNLEVGKWAGRQVSYRFRASHSGVAASVRLFLIFRPGYGAGDGGRLRVELRGDDGSEGHLPSEKILAAALVADPMPNPNNGTAFRLVDFKPGARLEEGALYHLVFSNPAPDPVHNYVSVDDLYSAARRPGVQPGASDLNLAVLVKDREGTPWQINLAHTPIFCLRFEDGATLGQGYIDARSASMRHRIGGAQMAREVITVSGGDRCVGQVAVRVKRIRKTAPLALRLETGKGELIEEGEIAEADVPENYGWVTWKLRGPQVLKKGQRYHLVLRAAEADAYHVFPLQEGKGYGFGTPNLFSDGYYQVCDDQGNWSPSRKDFDMQFYFTVLLNNR